MEPIVIVLMFAAGYVASVYTWPYVKSFYDKAKGIF